MRIVFLLLVCILQGSLPCYAQLYVDPDDFVPRETVIFYDDFSGDAANTFPSHWYIQPCCNAKSYTSVRLCHVIKQGVDAMTVRAKSSLRESSTDDLPEPRLKEKDYLPDSFTLRYDFLLGSPDASATLYFHTNSPLLISFNIYNKDNAGFVIEATNDNNSYLASITSDFEDSKWHNFSLSYYKRKITCYVDDIHVLTIPDCHFDPWGFILSSQADNASYTNVRLATGKYLKGEQYNFGKLFIAKKFVTHSIHFDVNASTIKPESMEFVKRLAAWLKQNRSVKLEIDGHTDSDGDAAKNMKLSQDRADEVKKQLVTLGIDDKRLSSNGYGVTKPIQSNTTPEGKAENRRVEFIKK